MTDYSEQLTAEWLDMNKRLHHIKELMESLYLLSTNMKFFEDHEKKLALKQIMETYEMLTGALNSIADYMDMQNRKRLTTMRRKRKHATVGNHHRVRNNLQIIESLLHLQASKINDSRISDLSSVFQRIHTIAASSPCREQCRARAKLHSGDC